MRKDQRQTDQNQLFVGGLLFFSLCVFTLIARVALAQEADGFGGAGFNESEASPLMSFLGGLHPLAVHFPLGMSAAALFFEALFLISKNTTWQTTAFHTLTLGATLSIVTIFTGLTASSLGPFFAEDALTLGSHRLYGLTGAGMLLLTTYLGAQARIKKSALFVKLYRAGIAVTTVAVYIAGHFGAKLSGLSPF